MEVFRKFFFNNHIFKRFNLAIFVTFKYFLYSYKALDCDSGLWNLKCVINFFSFFTLFSVFLLEIGLWYLDFDMKNLIN